MTQIISDYYLGIETAVAGALYDVMEQGGRSASLSEVSQYARFLAKEIEQRGVHCHMRMDRNKTRDFEKWYSDIVAIDRGVVRLLDGKGQEDLLERFFGKIPLVVIRAMGGVEPERWQFHSNRPAFDEGKYLGKAGR